MNRILTILKDKYRQTDNLMVFTKEMEKAIGLNDLDSLDAVLNMRQNTIDRIDDLNAEISKILTEMDKAQKDKVKQILEVADESVKLENPLEINIFDTNRMTMSLLKKVVALNDAINKKMPQKG